MLCPNCQAPIEERATFCGNCGQQVTPVYARGIPFSRQQGQAAPNGATTWGNMPGEEVLETQLSNPDSRSPGAMPFISRPYGMTPANMNSRTADFAPHLPSPVRSNRRNFVFLSIILGLLVLGISAGALTLWQNMHLPSTQSPAPTTVPAASGPQAAVLFSDSPEHIGTTDSVKVNVSGLAAPPAGTRYNAWIINDQNEQVVALGALTVPDQAEQPGQTGQNMVLNFTGTGIGLLSEGNRLEITQEKAGSNLPSGQILLSATFPAQAFVHIKHLLVSFPDTPGKIGLLVGLRQQTKLLSDQAQMLKNIHGNSVVTQCIAQNMLTLLEGKKGSHTRSLPDICVAQHVATVGDGYGLLGDNNNGYVALAATHASLAASQSDSTALIQRHAGHVLIAMDDLKGWLTTLDQDVQGLLANPGNSAKLAEIFTLSDHAFNGVDLDDDGNVDPVKGEAGALTAYAHGQLMATLTLLPKV